MTKSTREREGKRQRDRDRQRDRGKQLKKKYFKKGGGGENKVIKTHMSVFTNPPSCIERHNTRSAK